MKIRRISSTTGAVIVRDSLQAAFFFAMPIHEAVDGLRAVLDEYLLAIPKDALRWAAVGANAEEWSEVTDRTVPACRALLREAPASKRVMTALQLVDGATAGEAAGFAFELEGEPKAPNFADNVCLVQWSVPLELLSADSVETFASLATRAFEHVGAISGYLSPALSWSPTEPGYSIPEARAIAMRHPGLDFPLNTTSRITLGRRVVGARWITYLGSEIVASLGDAPTLRGSLSEAIEVRSLANGLMIRAGTMPEVGDVNAGEQTPLLCEVARLLEPVTKFDDVRFRARAFGRDAAMQERWERRFLS